MHDTAKYQTIYQIVQSGVFPFSLGQLRHYLLHRHKNGLDVAIRKIGRRLYIRMDLFNSWVDGQGK